ncbi:glycerophosphoryl diester phosphodiesterase [Tistlia consotensis]|uniref:Glycerophosphoryl diester phosphodiesterase n=1 Tax=Tistlia consotensis USBA 355 TaxID=560819 RepID=A0A1Y6CLN0_9PROT|nr:glycerophosphodiester phosphodiesterase [Tistlia consotensis]SMF74920.1 glycerophosphoryl diester phosphodiesterase [Tistlia consotensis USBA 355]SNS11450.1 glycerophosphoryl diester phosphodiesterase [Tistlia consotensis]
MTQPDRPESPHELANPRALGRLSANSLGALLATLLLLGAGLYVSFDARSFTPTALAGDKIGFELLGHRGTCGLMPENTLPAFEKALAIGVTTLELDVNMTADGVPVVIHDRRLPPDHARGPDGQWLTGEGPPILSLTLAQLQRYDLGCAKPGGKTAKHFPDQPCLDHVPVPTLAAVLALGEARSGGHVRYSIETKLAPDDPEASAPPRVIATAVVDAIRKAGVQDRANIQSFDWRSLAVVHELAPGLPTVHLTAERSWLDNLQRGRPGLSAWLAGLDADDYPGKVPALVKAAGGAVWSPYYRDLREGDIATAHDLGLRVVVWTVDDPVDMGRLIDDGADGIVTDYPDRLRKVMADKGLPLPAAYPGSSD